MKIYFLSKEAGSEPEKRMDADIRILRNGTELTKGCICQVHFLLQLLLVWMIHRKEPDITFLMVVTAPQKLQEINSVIRADSLTRKNFEGSVDSCDDSSLY